MSDCCLMQCEWLLFNVMWVIVVYCNVSDCCLMQCEWLLFNAMRVIVVYRQVSNFSTISWWEQGTKWRNDDEVYLMVDQHAKVEFYRVNPLKQEPIGALGSYNLTGTYC